MNVKSYESVAGFLFGSSLEKAKKFFGEPIFEQKNYIGQTELHYQDKILFFCAENREFCECTIPYGIEAEINEIPLEWTSASMKKLCEIDGNPMEISGTIVLFNLGMAIPDFKEEEDADKAITFFQKGIFDDLKREMQAVSLK